MLLIVIPFIANRQCYQLNLKQHMQGSTEKFRTKSRGLNNWKLHRQQSDINILCFYYDNILRKKKTSVRICFFSQSEFQFEME